jgi:hypothetical protein
MTRGDEGEPYGDEARTPPEIIQLGEAPFSRPTLNMTPMLPQSTAAVIEKKTSFTFFILNSLLKIR